MRTLYNLLFSSLFLVSVACQYEFPDDLSPAPSPGEADFSKMVSIGSSITAGVMDGALYNRAQQNSFAVILAEQLKEVGGGPFNLPNINAEAGFFGPGPEGLILGRLILRENPNTGQVLPNPIVPGNPYTPYEGDKAALNNFGVNRITLATSMMPEAGDLSQPQHPAFNPGYARFASNPGTSTLVGDAAAALADGGTFFTFWLGKNDVLGYALTGGVNPALLTSDENFTLRYNAALNMMLSANPDAKGAVANIPGINALPYFNLVPWNAVPLSAGQANAVNQGFQGYNQGLAQAHASELISAEELELRTISFQQGQNGFLMEDETLIDLSELGLPSIRQSNPNDRATLFLSQVLGQPVGGSPTAIYGVSVPVEDEYVLVPAEQEEIAGKVNSFNAIIQAATQSHAERLVLVDIHDLFNKVSQGAVSAAGVPLTASIAPPNGGLSVDGVHPNARGSAFVANHFIDAINEKWNANIPRANPNNFMGNDLPR
jgi:lysophospholipase L1-like esterase